MQPELRISAYDALHSPYFTSVLPKAVYSIDKCKLTPVVSDVNNEMLTDVIPP